MTQAQSIRKEASLQVRDAQSSQHSAREILKYLAKWERSATYAELRDVGGAETFKAVNYLMSQNVITRAAAGHYHLLQREAA